MMFKKIFLKTFALLILMFSAVSPLFLFGNKNTPQQYSENSSQEKPQSSEKSDDCFSNFTIDYIDSIFYFPNQRVTVGTLNWTTLNGTEQDFEKSIENFSISYDIGNKQKLLEKRIDSTAPWFKDDVEKSLSHIQFDGECLKDLDFQEDWDLKISFDICYLGKRLPYSHIHTFMTNRASDRQDFNNIFGDNGNFFDGKISTNNPKEEQQATIYHEKSAKISGETFEVNKIWDISTITTTHEFEYVIVDFNSKTELKSEYTPLISEKRVGIQGNYRGQFIEERISQIQLILKVKIDNDSWIIGCYSEMFQINLLFNDHVDDFFVYSRGTINASLNSLISGFGYIYVHAPNYENIKNECYIDIREIYYLDGDIQQKNTNIKINLQVEETTGDTRYGDSEWTKIRVDLAIPMVAVQPLFVRAYDHSGQYKISVYTPTNWIYVYDEKTHEYIKDKPISIVSGEQSLLWIKFRDECAAGTDKIIVSESGSHVADKNQPSAIYENQIGNNGNTDGSYKNNVYWSSHNYDLRNENKQKISVIDELQMTIKNNFLKNGVESSIRDNDKYWDLIQSYACPEFSSSVVDTSSVWLKIYDYVISNAGNAFKGLVGSFGIVGTVLNLVGTASYNIVSDGLGFLKSFISDTWGVISNSFESVKDGVPGILRNLVSDTSTFVNELFPKKRTDSKNDDIYVQTRAFLDDIEQDEKNKDNSERENIKEKMKENSFGSMAYSVSKFLSSSSVLGKLSAFISAHSSSISITKWVANTVALFGSFQSNKKHKLEPCSVSAVKNIEKLVPNYWKRNLYFANANIDPNTDANYKLNISSRIVDKWSEEPYFTKTHVQESCFVSEKIKLTTDKWNAKKLSIEINRNKKATPGLNKDIARFWVNKDSSISKYTQILGEIYDENDNPIRENGWGIEVEMNSKIIENEYRSINVTIPETTKHTVFYVACEVVSTDPRSTSNLIVSSDKILVENSMNLATGWNISNETYVCDPHSGLNKTFTFASNFKFVGNFQARICMQNEENSFQESSEFKANVVQNGKIFSVIVEPTKYVTNSTKKYFLVIEKVNSGNESQKLTSLFSMSPSFSISYNYIPATIVKNPLDKSGKIREVKKGTWTNVGTIVQEKTVNQILLVDLTATSKGDYNLFDSQIKLVQTSEKTFDVLMYVPNHKLGYYDNGQKFPMNISIKMQWENKWIGFDNIVLFNVIPV